MEQLSAALDALAVAAAETGQQAWLVGGCLRDALLRRPVRDVDLVVSGDPSALAGAMSLPGRLPEHSALVRLRNRTIRLVLSAHGPVMLDLAPLRNASLPDDLATRDYRVNALALPLTARDQFIALLEPAHATSRSAAVLPAPPSLIDPLDGYRDLRARRLSLAAEDALSRDPGRILRGARLAASLGFTLERGTLAHMRLAAPLIATIARERIGEEVSLLLDGPDTAIGWQVLARGGALPVLFPSLAEQAARARATATRHLVQSQAVIAALHPGARASAPDATGLAGLSVLRAWLAEQPSSHSGAGGLDARQAGAHTHAGGHRRISLLRWAVLAHALAAREPHPLSPAAPAERPLSVQPGANLASTLPSWLPGGTIGQVARAVWSAWRLAYTLLSADATSDAEWRRFIARHERADAGLYAVLAAVACQAACARRGARERQTLERMAARVCLVVTGYLCERDRWLPPPLVNGRALMCELGVPPGSALGAILTAVRDAQLAGSITTRAEAIALARARATSQGLV